MNLVSITNISKKLVFNSNEDIQLALSVTNLAMDSLNTSFVIKGSNSIYRSFEYSTVDGIVYYVTFAKIQNLQTGPYSVGISLNDNEVYINYGIQILVSLSPIVSSYTQTGITGDLSTITMKGTNLISSSLYYNCMLSYVQDTSLDTSIINNFDNIRFAVNF